MTKLASSTQLDDLPRRAERPLRWLIAAAAVFVMLLFVVTALRRVRYPYELEQLEGSVFLAALRVFHGQAVYVRPSLGFVPYMYPPGFYWVTAALGHVAGMSLVTMRLVSTLSTVGCFGVLFALVHWETRRTLAALAAAGLYAGCYPLCNGWFDLGRLDSFFVLLVLLSLVATRRAHPVLAALLWSAAFLTKQSILPVAFVMMAVDWRRPRRTLGGLVALAAFMGGAVVWLDRCTQGWFRFYVFAVPRANSDIRAHTLALFWPQSMLRPLALALMVIAAAVVFTRPSLRSARTRFYLATCSVMVVFWVVDAHAGSTVNALMPVYAVVALLFGLAIARLEHWMPSLGSQVAAPAMLLLLLAVLAQESAGLYDPGDYVPPMGDQASIRAAVATIAAQSGEVYVAQHPYYAWLANKPTAADLVALHDAIRPNGEALRGELQGQMLDALASHRFSAIVLDAPDVASQMDAFLGTASRRGGTTFYNDARRIPGTDMRTRPEWMLTHTAQTSARGQ